MPDKEMAKKSLFQFNYVNSEHEPKKIYCGGGDDGIFDVESSSQWFWKNEVKNNKHSVLLLHTT